jgi:phosphatidate phosphatase APP1
VAVSQGQPVITPEAPPPPHEPESTRWVRAWQRLVALAQRAAARIERILDGVRWGVRRRFGRLGPLEILAYRGFGTPTVVLLTGRVVEARTLSRSRPADRRWRNVVRMVRRFLSSEVPYAEVQARFGPKQASVRSDEEGYFYLRLEPEAVPAAAADPPWHAVELQVSGAPVRGWTPVRAQAEVLVPGPAAELGIVSDIDDTVIQTHVTQRLRMIWTTLVENAQTRLPFEGTTELYRALAAGPTGRGQNPVFYVSKSPWNLYDLLVEFLDLQQLPRGPLLLRDIGLHSEGPLDHKTTAIERILAIYVGLPFILIGDNGERDPDIYLQIAARHPGRIRAIYIREVGTGPGRHRQLTDLAQQARQHGTEMLLVSHAREALAHARAQGLAPREPPG